MVLADLKAMAAQLGIKGTSGLRKGDLVSAIASHQNSSAPAAGSAPAASGRATATATPDTSPASGDGDAPQRPARRRAAGRPEGAPNATAPAATPPAAGASGAPSGRQDAATQHHSAGSADREGSADSPARPTTEDAAAEHAAEHSTIGQSTTEHAAAERSTTEHAAAEQSGADQSAAEQPTTGRADRQDRPSYDGDDGPRSSRRNRRNRRDRDRGAENGAESIDGAPAQNGQQSNAQNGQQDGLQNTGQQNGSQQNGGQQNGGQAPAARDTQNRDSQNSNRDNQRNGRQDRNGQDRTAQDRNGQDRNQDRNGQDRNGQDEDQEGRRGRRFRDRNRRTRDRFADAPTDTEVRDDDVLVPVAGIVDVLDSYAFIRTSGYLSGPNDVYVSLSQIRKNGLRRGDAVTGAVRAPREGETAATRQKFNALVRLDSVNGQDPESAKDRPEFTKLTPLYPNDRLRLETESHILTTRIIDLVMPVGKGQRALIVSPPKAGKTSILQAIANAITTNNPEVHLMVVLVDERPEEVTDMQRSVKGEVIASTFDRPPADHTMVAELSIERAKRLVEMGRDVVVLLDSITRLGRAYNLAAPASGRILSGGVDSTALFPPKRFLGAARNIENGGSLTIFASALVETGSAGDTVIFEEFKGTGNAELKLDRRIADKRIFPAIDVDQSSTRKEDLLLSPDELAITVKLRRVLSALDSQQALELLLDRLRKTKSNVEFLMQVAKTTNGVGVNND